MILTKLISMNIIELVYTSFIVGYAVWIGLYYNVIKNEIINYTDYLRGGAVLFPFYDYEWLEIDDDVYFLNHMLLIITVGVSLTFGGYTWAIMALLTHFCIRVQNMRRKVILGW